MNEGIDAVVVFRIVVLGTSAVMVGLTIAVLHAYLTVWRQNRKRSATGLLPFHVWTIAVAHLIALAYMTADLIRLTADDVAFGWRGPTILASSVFGILSLASVLRFEVQRKRALRGR